MGSTKAEAVIELAKVECEQARHDHALARLRDFVDTYPECIEAWKELGEIGISSSMLPDALDDMMIALHYHPANRDILLLLGRIRLRLEQYHEAIEPIQNALVLDEKNPKVLSLLALAYYKSKKYPEAISTAREALKYAPEDYKTKELLAVSLFMEDDYNEAYELLTSIVHTCGNNLNNYLLLGQTATYLGYWDKALDHLEVVLKQEPNNFEARWTRAHVLLAQKRFSEGWKDYQFRFYSGTKEQIRRFPYPRWNSGSIEGKNVLVLAEQGLGDEIMFASCLKYLQELNPKQIIVECEDRLVSLFTRSFPFAKIFGGKHDVRPLWLNDLPDIDYQIESGMLPGFFRNQEEDFPAHKGYLYADATKVQKWQSRLNELGSGLKVGISWRGGLKVTRTGIRTISLDQWVPIFRVGGAHFINLQYGDCIAERANFYNRTGCVLIHWQEAIDDYDETAALCCVLDLVISVCTSIVHLNGALGRPVWVLTPFVPEWRYHNEGEKMLWYPSVQLIRQQKKDDWQPVILNVARRLESLIEQRR